MSYFFNNHRSKKLTFILIASTGLFSSQIHGSNLWERIGPYGGNIADMEVIDSTPDCVYICSYENAHFSKSSDCGTTWSLPVRIIPDNSLGTNNASILVIDPLKNKNRYCLYDAKFYASHDYGKTWKEQSSQFENAFDIVKSTLDSALFFGASQTRNQSTNKVNFSFTRSKNEGITWEYKILISNRNNSSAQCIALDPINHNTVYIGGYETDSALNRSFPRLFKSTDGGETFNDISAGLIDSTSNYSVEVIAVHPKFPHIILCAGKGSYLYRSVDTGYSWTKNRAPQQFYSLAMNPFLPGIVFAGGNPYFWKSSDTGRTWALCTTGLVKGIFRKVAIHPVTPEIVYTINQYGFFKTTNSGLTWAESDTNVSATVILDIVFAPSREGILYAATKYSGFFRSTNNGGTWERRMMPYLCQSFSGCAIHPTDPNTLIAAGKYG